MNSVFDEETEAQEVAAPLGSHFDTLMAQAREQAPEFPDGMEELLQQFFMAGASIALTLLRDGQTFEDGNFASYSMAELLEEAHNELFDPEEDQDDDLEVEDEDQEEGDEGAEGELEDFE